MFKIFSRRKELNQLCFSTDIHNHILPGVDHGSPDTATSLELIDRMKQWGIRRIYPTPHVTDGTFENTPQSMDAAFNTLREALDARGKGDFMPAHSAEYRLDSLFMDNYNAGTLHPFPNNYLLVENSFMQEPWGLDDLLFRLKVDGFKPVLAHPERYLYYHSDKSRYKALHQAGTLFQMNLLSLAGYHGKDEKRMAEWLISEGLVDFLATDMHHHRHADCLEGYLYSKESTKHLKALEGRLRNDSAFC